MLHFLIKEIEPGVWTLSRISSAGAFTGRTTYPDAESARAVAHSQDPAAPVEICASQF